MPRPLKIVKLALEDVVMDGRRRSLSNREIALACTQACLDRGHDRETISESAVTRYLATLDEATVPALHEPQAVEANAQVMPDVLDRVRRLDELLQVWIEEAHRSGVEKYGVMYDVAQQKVVAADSDEALEPVPIFVADWQARTQTANTLLKHITLITDLLERLYNAEQVELFQRATLEAIRNASPETAKAIVEAMQRESTIVRAKLLGAAA